METTGKPTGDNTYPAGQRVVTAVPADLTTDYTYHDYADVQGRKFVNEVGYTTAYEDATGTPVVSPKTSQGTSATSLTIPAKAKYVVLIATAAIRFANNADMDGDGTGDGYMYWPAYVPTYKIPVVDGTAISFRIDAASGTCSVYFYFGT